MKINQFEFLFITITIVFINYSIIFSQDKTDTIEIVGKANIVLLARADKDSIVLRWGPSTPGGWVIANRIGYNIEKIRISSDTLFGAENFIKLNNSPIKPLSLDEWKASVPKENVFSAIAAQAIYGKRFIPQALNENNLNALKNAADELVNRFSFALFAADNDAQTASAMGLRFVDRDVKEGERYLYRVFLSANTNEYSFDTGYVFVDVAPAEKFPAPLDLSFESGDESITLKWKDNPLLKFSGYYLYRSEDGKDFKKLNDMPVIFPVPKEQAEEQEFSFIDTATINYKEYYYKIYGVTPFAELSEPAEIKAYSKDKTAPAAPILDKPKQFNADEISLSWKLEELSDDLVGFVIARSDNPLYNFEIITEKPLPKNVFNYTDKVSQLEEVYYAVASVDTAGNMAFSLPHMVILIDTVPPSIPKGLTGIIDTNGVVTLKWNLNPEWNLLGYRVLRANDPTHEFQQLTGSVHLDTVFIDTVNVNTLTRYVYYSIAAVNTRYQHSELSPILALKRPDKIPPAEAVFSHLFVTDSSVYIEWIQSTSEDLAYQKLLKRKQGENQWKQIDSLPPSVSNYKDNNVEKTVSYEYTIVSVDSSGLQSPFAFPVIGRPYDTGFRPSVEKFSARYDVDSNSVILDWVYNKNLKEKYWFVIYRSNNDAELYELKAVNSLERNYIDNQISKGKKYYYAIAVVTSMGGQSEKVILDVDIPAK
ncbi:MAG: fibronectin type III domain-containing protein [Ignavibacterium sp.]